MSRMSVPVGLHVGGLLTADSLTVPNSSVGDTQFNPADPLTAQKQYHQYQPVFSQARGASPAANTGQTIHVAYGAGTIVGFGAGFMVDESAWTGNVTVDLKKNGTTVLSSVVTLNSGTTVGSVNTVGLAVTTYVAGDVFEVVITYTAGTGTPPQGVFARAVLREAAQP